jgi:DNA-binding response OmpR family regulator
VQLLKLLLVEDDPDLADLLGYAFRREGYNVLRAANGLEALNRWEAARPDIILLDVNLPELSGYEVCRRIRQTSDTPIVMVTGRLLEEDALEGLLGGADDYVTKPVSVAQLVARVNAVLRRCQQSEARLRRTEVSVGDIILDPKTHEVTVDNRLVWLTPVEFQILFLLVMNEGRVIPYARLVEHVWGFHRLTGSKPLKTHIATLRDKLNLPWKPGAQTGIRAVPGIGYSLTTRRSMAGESAL